LAIAVEEKDLGVIEQEKGYKFAKKRKKKWHTVAHT